MTHWPMTRVLHMHNQVVRARQNWRFHTYEDVTQPLTA
jgi:hypothetical protein